MHDSIQSDRMKWIKSAFQIYFRYAIPLRCTLLKFSKIIASNSWNYRYLFVIYLYFYLIENTCLNNPD